MIKVNLLNSVTDRVNSGGGVAAVEKKIVDPKTQSYIIAVSIACVMFVVMGFDYVSANSNRTQAEQELAEQERIAQQMQAVIKEQTDLDKKTKEVNARINAVQSLRSSQKGPVAVLSAINERIPQMDNFRLDIIEQKGGSLVISGDSPNEAAVTQFGRSLEFSSGLFSNVSIELQRKTLEGTATAGANEATPMVAPKGVETVSFTIKCSYTPPVPVSLPVAPVAIPPASPAAAKQAAAPAVN